MNFIKTNPVPAAIGGGLLALGIYQMVKPKKKTSSLSGYKTTRKSKTTKAKTLPKKAQTKGRAKGGSTKKKITSIKLF